MPDLVIDAGFYSAIEQSWDTLISGQRLRVKFLSLVNGKVYALRVDRAKNSRCVKKIVNPDYVCFVVKSTIAIVNWFVKPIRLLYHLPTRKLVQFSGQVNILDTEGNTQWAMIRYRHFEAIFYCVAFFTEKYCLSSKRMAVKQPPQTQPVSSA